MMRISEHPFEIPAADTPGQFVGFISVGYASGKWHCGCDTNSADDAHENMVDAARRAMVSIAAVLENPAPEFFPHTVRMFRVEGDE